MTTAIGGRVIERSRGQPIDWFRPPLARDVLLALSRRSDLRGAAQTVGFLGVLALTGSLAWYSLAHLPWYAVAGLLFLHGTCWAFLSNGFHELSHGSVFSTPWLNRAFLAVFSFLGWNNPVLFWASHTEHHKFTLHRPDDLEVVESARPTLRGYLAGAIVNPSGLRRKVLGAVRHSRGRLDGEWEEHLFPASRPDLRRRLAGWARILLVGHGAIVVAACYFRLWAVPLLITLAPFYAGWLQWLCNESQHTGLPGEVADFRLCSRTIHLNPVLGFLYFHMNYHTEHHLYAGVPCYRLAELHRAVRADMPACARGLVAVWREINATLQHQKVDPGYRLFASLPPARPRAAAAAAGR